LISSVEAFMAVIPKRPRFLQRAEGSPSQILFASLEFAVPPNEFT
jgi:hypothetical protein